MPVNFKDRPDGSESKLRTYRDGWKILNVILNLARHERPITFFGLFAALAATLAVVLGAPVVSAYVETSTVPQFPSLFVASFLLVMSCLVMVAGLILDGIRKARYEHSRLAYMRHPAVAITEPRSQVAPAASKIQSMRRVGVQAKAS